jgi:hypothetical protein
MLMRWRMPDGFWPGLMAIVMAAIRGLHRGLESGMAAEWSANVAVRHAADQRRF